MTRPYAPLPISRHPLARPVPPEFVLPPFYLPDHTGKFPGLIWPQNRSSWLRPSSAHCTKSIRASLHRLPCQTSHITMHSRQRYRKHQRVSGGITALASPLITPDMAWAAAVYQGNSLPESINRNRYGPGPCTLQRLPHYYIAREPPTYHAHHTAIKPDE